MAVMGGYYPSMFYRFSVPLSTSCLDCTRYYQMTMRKVWTEKERNLLGHSSKS